MSEAAAINLLQSVQNILSCNKMLADIEVSLDHGYDVVDLDYCIDFRIRRIPDGKLNVLAFISVDWAQQRLSEIKSAPEMDDRIVIINYWLVIIERISPLLIAKAIERFVVYQYA